MTNPRIRPESSSTLVGSREGSGSFAGRKIIFTANTGFFIQNFLLAIIRSLVDSGFEVIVVCPEDPYVSRIRECGVRVVPLIRLSRKSLNPIHDFRLLLEFIRVYRREKPDAVVHFTVKPNIYGNLASGILRIKSFSIITGLGYLFIKTGILNLIAKMLYRFALRYSLRVAFLNRDDSAVFTGGGLVNADKVFILPGTGIDVKHFEATPQNKMPSVLTKRLVFLMSGRILWDKGVGEFVEAARLVKKQGWQCEFLILGAYDEGNPSSVPKSFIQVNQDEGIIQYLGQVADVREIIGRSDVVVLPSYREGVPRALLEAMSMEKPIIASDACGCRDVVDDGINGFLVGVKDAVSLSKAMITFLEMEPDRRREFGRKGREKVLREFDDEVVTRIFLRELNHAFAHAANSISDS